MSVLRCSVWLQPVPTGKTRICVASFPYAWHGIFVADAIAKHFPQEFETWYYVSPKDEFYAFLKVAVCLVSKISLCAPQPFLFVLCTQLKFDSVPFPAHLKGHDTSPIIWLEVVSTDTPSQNEIKALLGPSTALGQWALSQPRLAAVTYVRLCCHGSCYVLLSICLFMIGSLAFSCALANMLWQVARA
jgi:hypothetical protein